MADTEKLGLCVKSHGFGSQDLVDGAEVVVGGRFIPKITSATDSLVY